MSAFIKLYDGNFEDISHEVYQLRRLIERTAENNDAVPLYNAGVRQIFRAMNWPSESRTA